MSQSTYVRTVEELKEVASMFWPEELSERAAALSVIPILLKTQDDFVSILSVPVKDINGIFGVLENSAMPANLFLKHLVILADFGGEMLQRINSQFDQVFPEGYLEYLWQDKKHIYRFNVLPLSGSLTNNKMGISGKKLFDNQPLTELIKDVIVILLVGSASTDETTSMILSKCEVGDYLGKPADLTKYIKQRYIWVSRITGGSTSNNLGQIAQKFIQEYLDEYLEIDNVNIQPNGHIPTITHTEATDQRLTTFDLVVSKNGRYVAIEISFQVTTNSVIERKAGQAQSRYIQVENANQKIAYVLDGAGNFQRENALKTLCSYSHCTVALSKSELDILCNFIRENL